jgi:hypothetical protein
MAWSYHKHIKIIPGIVLHIGRDGLSITIGPGPADGHRKTEESSLSIQSLKERSDAVPGLQPSTTRPAAVDNIFSADIPKITSPGMQGIKEAMLMSDKLQHELRNDLEAVRWSLKRSRLKLQISRLLLYGIINESFSRKIKDDITAQEVAIRRIGERIMESAVTLSVEFESATARELYQRVVQAFKQLMNSHKIWDVTSAHYQDRVAARSSASTVVNKKAVRFSLTPLPGITTEVEVLHFQNANGADLYFYPGFIVMQRTPGDFALIALDELIFSHGAVRFTETGPVPTDSKIIDQTWAKVNKNGTPDRRFSSNYQIPIVRYGELRLKTATGLHEEYECSNYEATESFGLSFGAYQRYLRMLRDGNQSQRNER